MKKRDLFVEITLDAIYTVIDFIKNNLMTFANILNYIIPYVMYIIGQKIVTERGYVTVGCEVFIPLIYWIFIYYMRSAANKLGKGITIPLPSKRFTEIDDDGEVSIENRRVQELILYMADLEDWLERKGLI